MVLGVMSMLKVLPVFPLQPARSPGQETQGIPITKEGNGKPRVVLYKIDPVSIPGFTAGVCTKGWCSVEGTAESCVGKKVQ